MNNKNNSKKLEIDLKDPELIQKIASNLLEKMETGMTFKDALGLSNDTLEQIYALAYGYYNQGKYLEALSLFYILAGASPNTYKFVLGLASSYHQLEGFKDAAMGFYIALNLNPNPLPAYYLLDCFLKMHLNEEAKEMVEVALQLCEGEEEYKDLKHRLLLIKKSLQKN